MELQSCYLDHQCPRRWEYAMLCTRCLSDVIILAYCDCSPWSLRADLGCQERVPHIAIYDERYCVSPILILQIQSDKYQAF